MAHVYMILCVPTGDFYIGGSVMAEGKRWSNHRSHLRFGRHRSSAMQAAYDAHGEASFELGTLVRCSSAKLIRCEQRAIDVLKPVFNLAPTAGSVLGIKRTEAQVEARRRAYGETQLAQRNGQATRHEVRGELLTARDISKKYDINLCTLRNRIARCEHGEALIGPDRRGGRRDAGRSARHAS